MTIRAVVFDIGGVLEITQDLSPTRSQDSVTRAWEARLGLAPGKIAREQEREAYGFEELVDEIVYSHECGMAKPDPRCYALVCERLGVRPEETVFIDDYAPNVEAAREAGLHAVHYADHATAMAEIERLLGKV